MSDISGSTGGVETWIKKAEGRIRGIESATMKARIPRQITSTTRPDPAAIQPGVSLFETDTNRVITVNADQTGYIVPPAPYTPPPSSVATLTDLIALSTTAAPPGTVVAVRPHTVSGSFFHSSSLWVRGTSPSTPNRWTPAGGPRIVMDTANGTWQDLITAANAFAQTVFNNGSALYFPNTTSFVDQNSNEVRFINSAWTPWIANGSAQLAYQGSWSARDGSRVVRSGPSATLHLSAQTNATATGGNVIQLPAGFRPTIGGSDWVIRAGNGNIVQLSVQADGMVSWRGGTVNANDALFGTISFEVV